MKYKVYHQNYAKEARWQLRKKELRIIIALHGNKRIPHLEEELFSRFDIALDYMRALHTYKTYHSLQDIIFLYAKDVLKERWPVAEQMLFTDEDLKRHYLEWFRK